MPPALGVSVFDIESVCAVGWGLVAPVANLPLGSIVPHHAHCLVLMTRFMGLGPGKWVKQFNSICWNPTSNLSLEDLTALLSTKRDLRTLPAWAMVWCYINNSHHGHCSDMPTQLTTAFFNTSPTGTSAINLLKYTGSSF